MPSSHKHQTLRISLRFKAIVLVLFVLTISVVVFVFVTVNDHHRMVEELMVENYLKFTRMLSFLTLDVLAQNDFSQLQAYFNRTVKEEISYLQLENLDGEVLVQAGDIPAVESHSYDFYKDKQEYMPSDGTQEMIIRELGQPHGFFHQAGHNFEITLLLSDKNQTVGKLRVGISTAVMNQKVAQTSLWGIRIIGFFLSVGVIFLFFVDRQLKKILTNLIHITTKMIEGDLSRKVEIHTGDEFEVLGNSFNRMAEAIQEREEKIQRYAGVLEKKVKERTRELKTEKDKLQAILDNVPSAFVVLDKNLYIQSASAALERIADCKIERIRGKKCFPAVWDTGFCEQCATRQALKSGNMETLLVRHKKEDGEEQFIEHISTPIRKNGEIESIIEIITDVTKREKLQEELIRSEKLAATGEMAAVFAHELRNSLTSVNMILQLQLEAQTDGEALEVAIESVNQMEKLVSDLLQFARPTPLEKSVENINTLVEESIEFSHYQFERKGISVETHFDPTIPMIMVDKEQLKKALVNLILNAFQAIDREGEIRVTTEKIQLKKELRDVLGFQDVLTSKGYFNEIVFKRGTNVIQITVEDTGCGIPSEVLKRIFDPFYTTKVEGTGLGLSLVKRVVNEHGGVITVESSVGIGTTFALFLPIA